MELNEFIKKWNKKKCDFDGVYGAQCVDLFRQYSKEVLNIAEHTGSCSSSGGAKDLFLDYDKMPLEKKYFEQLTKNKQLKQGDVIIWNKTDTNKYGHVAIFICNVGNEMLVFEQNGFSQNGAEFAVRNKNNLLGALRRK